MKTRTASNTGALSLRIIDGELWLLKIARHGVHCWCFAMKYVRNEVTANTVTWLNLPRPKVIVMSFNFPKAMPRRRRIGGVSFGTGDMSLYK